MFRNLNCGQSAPRERTVRQAFNVRPPGELIIAFGLDDHAIHVGLGIAPDLPLKASLNGLPVGGTCVLEPERHGVVAVGPEGRDEGGLLLIRLFQGDLMVT